MADPILANGAGGEDCQPENSREPSGQGTDSNTSHPHQGPLNASFAVEFSPKDYDHCVHDLSMGAANAHAGVHLPEGIGLQDFCRRHFPHDLTATPKFLLQVDFTLHEENCVERLTDEIKGADGVVQFGGGSAESACEALFGSSAGGGQSAHTSTQTSSLGDDHTERGGCVIQRHCGDLHIPEGGTVGNSHACGVVCAPPQRCENGKLVPFGDSLSGHQFEAACPDDPFSL